MNKGLFNKYINYVSNSVIGMLGLSFYILADTYFVANGIGIDGLAALNLALPVFSITTGISSLIGIGSASLYSIYRVQNKDKEANKIFMTALITGLATGIFLFVFGGLGARNLAFILGARGSILDMTSIYLRIAFIFSPAFILNPIFSSFVRNDGSPKLGMIAMVIGSFSNVIMDYIFIYILHLGMFGAILATGFSPIISLFILSKHLSLPYNSLKFKKIKYEINILKNIVRQGLSSLISELSGGVVLVLFNFLFLHYNGNKGVGAYGIVANIALVTNSLFTGIASGVQPLLSRSYGKNDNDKLKVYLKYSFYSVLILGLLVYLFIFLRLDFITGLFVSGNDESLKLLANQGMIIYFISVVFVGINNVFAIYFVSIKKPKIAHLISIFRGIILLIPITLLLALLFKTIGIWFSIPLCEGLVSFYSIYRYKKEG